MAINSGPGNLWKVIEGVILGMKHQWFIILEIRLHFLLKWSQKSKPGPSLKFHCCPFISVWTELFPN